MLFYFFFSSRRRHTRYIGDWSSDVCSSDLVTGTPRRTRRRSVPSPRNVVTTDERLPPSAANARSSKIGRASCRERVEISVVGVSLNKKRETTIEVTRAMETSDNRDHMLQVK